VTGGLGRRCKQLLDDLQETRGYWKLEVAALDRTVWRTGCVWGCATAVTEMEKKCMSVADIGSACCSVQRQKD